MFAGRLLGFAALLFVMAAIAAAIAPDPDERTAKRPRTGPTAVLPPPPPPGEKIQERLPGEDGRTVTIDARVGDIIALIVRSNGIDRVSVDELGILEPIDQETPVELNFIVDNPGTYEVLLKEAEKVVGRIEVAPRQAADGGSSDESLSEDSAA